ncbi:MAG: hypothetical protein IPI30_18540 [Saprospiraceae bacterium]|nr:hypothetical protein [Candidatus Vicinibacter affinis]
MKGNHQGVLAMISPIEFYKVEDLVQSAFESGQNPCFALLDGITDVHNFGAIARSAEVMGITGLIIGSRNSAPINWKPLKFPPVHSSEYRFVKSTILYAARTKKDGICYCWGR